VYSLVALRHSTRARLCSRRTSYVLRHSMPTVHAAYAPLRRCSIQNNGVDLIRKLRGGEKTIADYEERQGACARPLGSRLHNLLHVRHGALRYDRRERPPLRASVGDKVGYEDSVFRVNPELLGIPPEERRSHEGCPRSRVHPCGGSR
jgi:hypothetical protein